MIRVIAFTDRGVRLAERIPGDHEVTDARNGGTEKRIRESFEERVPLVFIGAAGIAVRLIAPYIKDKTTDPAVICMDEGGRFVIPLLSGHIGGANRLAEKLSLALDATPVITTATDINNVFAVDVFAKENGLGILNPSAIKTVSAKALKGQILTVKGDVSHRIFTCDYRKYLRVAEKDEASDIEIVSNEGLVRLLSASRIDPYAPLPERGEREERLLGAGIGSEKIYLYEKEFCVGIGCRRGTGYGQIFSFLMDVMKNRGLCVAGISSVSSIDIKSGEPGIINLCGSLAVPFNVYTAEELSQAEGQFASSAFVKSRVGVDNVCERAASLSAGAGGKKLVGKMKTECVTISIYRKGSR